MLVIYFFMGMAPFGDKTLLTVDLGQQYVDFFAYLKHVVTADWSGYFYSFSKGIGGDMQGVWAYYLMSPFNLVFVLLPLEQVALGVLIVTLLKYGAAGAAFTHLLVTRYQAGTIRRYWLVPGFTTAYALMAFAVANQLNTMWLDGLVWLPLIVCGMERMLDGESGLRYAGALGMILISNYYIGYMICLFLILYFFLYRSRFRQDAVRSRRDKVRAFWRDLWRTAGYSLLGVGMAAIVLVPTFYALLTSKVAYAKPLKWSADFAYNPLELLSKLFIGAFDYDQMTSGHPNLYAGALPLVLFIGYFFSKRFALKERWTTLVVTLILLVSMNAMLINKLWHGGQDPVWYPYRYSFVLTFIMLLYAFRMAQQLPVLKQRWLVVSVVALLAVAAYVVSQNFSFMTVPQVVVTSILILVVLGLLYADLGHKRWVLLLLGGLLLVEMGANAAIDLTRLSYVKNHEFSDYQKVLLSLSNSIKEVDQSPFYRWEKTFMRSKNDAFPAVAHGATHFGSTLESRTSTLFERLGFPNSISVISYSSGTPVTDALFGIRYYADSKDLPVDEELAHQLYRIRRSTPRKDVTQYPRVLEQERVVVHRTPLDLPLAFGVHSRIRDVVLQEHLPLENQQAILQAFAGSDEEFFIPFQFGESRLVNVASSADNAQNTVLTREDKTKEGRVDFVFTPKTNNRYYVTIAGAMDAKSLDFYNNNSEMEIYEAFRHRQVWQLAQNQAEQEVTFSIAFDTTDTLETRNVRLYRMNDEAALTVLKQRQEQGLVVTRFSNTHIEGHVTITDDSEVLFTSIPYDEGWTVTVDGQTVQTFAVLDSLLAVPISGGAHQIVFHFVPKGWWTGVLTTVGSLGFAGWLAWQQRNKRQQHAKTLRMRVPMS